MSETQKTYSARLPLLLGFATVVLMLGSLGAWSVGTRISGAVVASGIVQVESERQVVQHPDGGVVGEILARDGDEVKAGDVIMRLDSTFLRSELALVEQQLAEIFARRARLNAERDGDEAPDFSNPPELHLLDADRLAEQIGGQASLFRARRNSLEREQQQLAEQQEQIARQIEGAEAQLRALDKQRDLVAKEQNDVQRLFDQNLVPAARLLELQREAARLEGELGRLTSAIAEARKRISEIEIAILRLETGRQEEAITSLRDLNLSEIELEERRLSLRERLARLDIRAPASGTVFGSRIFAEQAVVRPAEPITYIVPSDQPLEVVIRISPTDIDQVYPGQPAVLMFTTFSSRTTPEVKGTVQRVSPDAEQDQNTGMTYFEVVVQPDAEMLASFDHVKLSPGMPVEAFMSTELRTPLSYLTNPLTVYLKRAFREE